MILINDKSVGYLYSIEKGGVGSGIRGHHTEREEGKRGDEIKTSVTASLNKETWEYELSSYDSKRDAVAALWNMRVKESDGKLTNEVTVFAAHRDFGSKLQDLISNKQEESFKYGETRELKCYSRKVDHIWNFYIQDTTKIMKD